MLGLTPRIAKLALTASFVLHAATGAAAPDVLTTPYDLFEVGPWSDDKVGAFHASPGVWRTLHQERGEARTWILLALPDGETAGRIAGERPRYLGRVRSTERVVLTAPAGRTGNRLRTGRPLTITPSGGTVAITTERPNDLARRFHGGFRTLDRPIPAPRPRKDGAPDRFEAILERARIGRAPRTDEAVRNIVEAVSPDSLESYVRALSEAPSGIAAIRWWEDSSTTGPHTDYIVAKFEEYLQDANVGVPVFQHAFPVVKEPGDTVWVANIIGKLPSARPDAGAILLTAHMDATALRSEPLRLCSEGIKDPSSGCDCAAASAVILANPDCEWDETMDPSPGADDNATGLAALFECARLLAPLDFDFDIYFVAFQAEEIGLVGSAAFADSVASNGQEIFAVLNLDMLGFNATLNELDIVTDESSEWFADWIVESGNLFVPQLPVEKLVEPFGRSDHASFWARGIDAVGVVEDVELVYPGYHQFDDLWETIFPVGGRPNPELQFQLAVQLGVATMARFALHYASPDLALPAGELDAAPVFGADFVAGRSIRLAAHVHNFGTSELTFLNQTVELLTARVRFYDGDPDDGGAVIGEQTRTTFFAAGGVVDFEMLWDTSDIREGFHEIHAVVEGLNTGYPELEISPDNNATSTSFFLQGPSGAGARILAHYTFPNPARGSKDAIDFYYELTRDAGVLLTVFDLEGNLVADFRTGEIFFSEGNEAGPNVVPGSTIFRNSLDLKSGVYVYTLRVTTDGAVTDRVKGKFALVR